MQADWTRAEHTVVLSDIHLVDAEPFHPERPHWKIFKRSDHFIDSDFKELLEHLRKTVPGPIELVLNGDIFDFDSVMKLPRDGRFSINWLERIRGLNSEEPKSRFKMTKILEDHPVWVDSIRQFVLNGNRVVFVIGNHDIELHWPAVKQEFLDGLELPEPLSGNVRFCEWFYISNRDTLIEHGNQYDAYCMAYNPVNPLIRKGHRILVRTPFGNLAGKYMVNGMGLFNPHANSSFIKSSVLDYLEFYFKYVMRTQPLLLWDWFWSAMVTLVVSVTEGLLPAMTDPLTIDDRVDSIAARANASPKTVLALRELHAHPAIYNPIKILRELWLDRALLLALIVFGSFQFFSVLNVFVSVSFRWFIGPIVLLTPAFIFYARSVESEVEATQAASFHMAPIAARIARVSRVINGHTHQERHSRIEQIEYLNTGTWSAAYHDVACTQPYGRKCYAHLRPAGEGEGEGRVAELFEWKKTGPEKIELVGGVHS